MYVSTTSPPHEAEKGKEMTEYQYKVDYITDAGVISAFYDDEYGAETCAVRLLGTETRSGAVISASKVFSPEGNLLNEFEF